MYQHNAPAQREQVLYQPDGLMVYIHKSNMTYTSNMAHPCHYHEDIEFVSILSGHMTYSVNGQICRIDEGEGIFVNANHLHYGYSEDGTDCTFLVMLLNPVLLSSTPMLERKYVKPLVENSRLPYQLLRRDVTWQRQLLELIQAAFDINSMQRQGYGLLLQSCYFQVWNLLYCNMPRQESGGDKLPDPKLHALRQMVSFVHTHLGEKITLDEIAAAGNLCPSACCKLFKKYLHQSPVAYLNMCRLSHSCELLRQEELSITEIAFRMGFTGASYFAEQFKKQYGCTPREFRSRCAKVPNREGMS